MGRELCTVEHGHPGCCECGPGPALPQRPWEVVAGGIPALPSGIPRKGSFTNPQAALGHVQLEEVQSTSG